MEIYEESTITQVLEKSDVDNYPLIVTFQNGVLNPKKVDLFDAELSNVANSAYKRKRLTLTASDGPSYVGEEEKLPVKSFLIVRNRKTAEAKLLEVGKVNLKNSLLETKKDIEKSSQYDDYSNLMVTFGGKRANRQLQQRTKMTVGLHTNLDILTQVAEEMEVKEEAGSEETAADVSLLSILPPCNRSAQDKSKVYDLEELIGDDVLNGITEYEGPSLIHIDELNEFTRALLPSSGLSDLSKTKMAAVIMIDDMIKFCNMPMKVVNHSTTSLSKHSAIHYRILELFCTKAGGSHNLRPLSLRDKAIAYILAMSLVVADYSIPLTVLSKLLKSGIQKMKTIGRAIGGSAQEDRLILKLPLPGIPIPRRAKKKVKD